LSKEARVCGSGAAGAEPGEIERRVERNETILGHIDFTDSCHIGDSDCQTQKQK
jgi:hypothetical protein